MDGRGERRQVGAQALQEVGRVGGDARYLAVGVQFLRERRLVDQLLAVVVVALAVRNVQVAGFEFVLDLRQHRQLEVLAVDPARSEEHTSELQSLMRISYAVLCLKKKTTQHKHTKLDK